MKKGSQSESNPLRKKAEKKLLEIQYRYQELMDHVRDTIFVISAEGILVSVNRAFSNITGWPTEKWTGKHFINLIHPEDVPRVVERFSEVLSGNTGDTIEIRILKNSGDYSFGEVLASPQIKDGVTVGILGIMRDITDRKKMEAELRKIEIRNYLLMAHSGLGIGYYDLSGKILMFNNEALKNMGGNASDYIGKNVTEVFGKKLGEEYIKRFRETGKSESAIKYEDQVNLNGQPAWYLSTHTRILNENGDVEGIQVISDDITSRYEWERKTKEKIEQLERFNNLMVDREIMMVKLKEEVNDLIIKSGGKQKYRIIK